MLFVFCNYWFSNVCQKLILFSAVKTEGHDNSGDSRRHFSSSTLGSTVQIRSRSTFSIWMWPLVDISIVPNRQGSSSHTDSRVYALFTSTSQPDVLPFELLHQWHKLKIMPSQLPGSCFLNFCTIACLAERPARKAGKEYEPATWYSSVSSSKWRHNLVASWKGSVGEGHLDFEAEKFELRLKCRHSP